MRQVPVRIQVLPDASDKWWFEDNSREQIGAQYEAVYQTTYQRMCAVITVIKTIVDKQGGDHRCPPSKVLEMFQNCANTTQAANVIGAESITEGYIKEVLVVRDHLFVHKRCQSIIAEMDELGGHRSVFNSCLLYTSPSPRDRG